MGRFRYKAILLFIIFLFTVSTVSALTAFTMELDAEQNSIFTFEKAQYNLSVTNYGDAANTFTVHTSDVSWYVTPKPILGVIQPSETKTISLSIAPRASQVNVGPNAVPVTVRETTERTERTREAIVFVKSADYVPPSYVPNVDLAVRYNSDVSSKEDLVLDIYLKNRNPLYIEGLQVVIDSPIFNKEYITNLDPLTEQSTKVPIKLNKYLEAKDHELIVEIFYQGEKIGSSKSDFRILPFSNIKEERTVKDSWFKKFVDIGLYNDGNVGNTYRVKYKINAFRKIFLSSSEEYTGVVEEDGQKYLVWDVTIDAQEAHAVTVTENYRLLIILILLAIVAIVGYYVLRSPVVVKKEVLITHASEEGVSGMKIRIYLQNRTKNSVSNIKVIDKISKIAEITKHVGLGSLEPTKIVRNNAQGTLVRWDIEMLEPYEERIITYNIRSGLKMVGDMRFEGVKVKFDTKTGSERTVYSNDVRLNLG